jgi:ketosteroid isomerase-like protein
LLAGLLTSGSAFADSDADFRGQVNADVNVFVAAYNAKNVDAIVQLFAADGVFIAADGKVYSAADISKHYAEEFGNGLHDESVALTDAHSTGDGGYADGDFKILIGDKNIPIAGRWTAAYLMDGGKTKIKMLAGSLPPPPPN